MKSLAKLGKYLYLKYATPKQSLSQLFKEHIGDRTEMTHAEFDKLAANEKQSIYLDCSSFIKNSTFQKIFQWELEEQSIDTMKSAENEFQFLVGKMSVYAIENIKARFKLYANKVNDTTPESFDKHAVL